MELKIFLAYSNMAGLRSIYGDNLVDAALQAATQATSKKTRTRVSRGVRELYNIKAADIKQVAKVLPIKGIGHMVRFRAAKQRLHHFAPKMAMRKTTVSHPHIGDHKARRQRVSVRVRKDRGRSVARGAFFGKGRNSGKLLLFRRKDESNNQSPVVVQDGPSIPHMVRQLDQHELSDFIASDVETQFTSRMKWEIEKALKQAARRSVGR